MEPVDGGPVTDVVEPEVKPEYSVRLRFVREILPIWSLHASVNHTFGHQDEQQWRKDLTLAVEIPDLVIHLSERSYRSSF